ncbi:hypothetical protein MOUN0_N07052 [Monosporozyma unispora]|nr:blue light receptor [Kazachstania unispora]
MTDTITGPIPFASQLEDIRRYIADSKKSKNNTTNGFNHNLKNVRNQSYLNQFNNGYQNSVYSYKNPNMRRENSFNPAGGHNNHHFNGYFNPKKNRNFYNNGGDYNSGMERSYRNYNNNSNFNSNSYSRRQQRNYNTQNYNNNGYNQNTNFTNHLRETYPQFYTDSNTNVLFNENVAFNGASQQQIDPHKSLMVTSLYNTYSQNSALNNFNNYPGSGTETNNENGMPIRKSNDATFTNNNNNSKSSLYEKFNMKTLDGSIQEIGVPSNNNTGLPTSAQPNFYSSPSFGNNTFANPISPVPSNESKFNVDLPSSISTTIASPNSVRTTNAFVTLTPPHNNFRMPNMSTNFINSNTSSTVSGNTRNMYLSQTAAPNYNGNGNYAFGSLGWNMSDSVVDGTSVNIAGNNAIGSNTSISSSTMNKSFGIWNNDMKVWN